VDFAGSKFVWPTPTVTTKPIDEWVHWVDEHLEDSYDSAGKPLRGRRWRPKADDGIDAAKANKLALLPQGRISRRVVVWLASALIFL